MSTITEVPEQVPATAELLARAVREGGYVTVTVRSPSGAHVTVNLVARKKRPGGQGWVPRSTREGRVGFDAGDAIEARDPRMEYPENYIGRFYKDTGEWKAGRGVDGSRVWVAERIIGAALSGVLNFARSEVFLSTHCVVCGRKLTHPESIEELTGEECGGRRNVGRSARRTSGPAVAVAQPETAAEPVAEQPCLPGLDRLGPDQLLDLIDSARGAMTEPDASSEVREEMRKVIARANAVLGRPSHRLAA